MIDQRRAALESGNHRGITYGISHNGMGYRCGYIFLEKGHPWYGKNANELQHDGDVCFNCGSHLPIGPLVNTCHGGITWCKEEDEHYVIGFDCAHAGDAADPALYPDARPPLAVPWEPEGYEVIRSTEYVREICLKMCDLAADARVALGAAV